MRWIVAIAIWGALTLPSPAQTADNMFGKCSQSEFPPGFPHRYDHCGFILMPSDGHIFVLVTTFAEATVMSSGADAGKIVDAAGDEVRDVGSISFSGEDALEGEGRQVKQSDGTILQNINLVSIMLPFRSPTFAPNDSGEHFSRTIPAVGACTWRAPFISADILSCNVQTDVGRFRFTFNREVTPLNCKKDWSKLTPQTPCINN